MYLTYNDYVVMGGTLEEAAFIDLEYEARTYIDWVTFNRLKGEEEIPQEVKDCVYHIIGLIKNKSEALNVLPDDSGSLSSYGAGIASQSNDGVSVSYNVLSAKEIIDNSESEVNKIIERYLQGLRNSLGHRLLYRGIYPDEEVR